MFMIFLKIIFPWFIKQSCKFSFLCFYNRHQIRPRKFRNKGTRACCGEPLEVVKRLVYRGSWTNASRRVEAQVTSRIANAKAAFTFLWHRWRWHGIALLWKTECAMQWGLQFWREQTGWSNNNVTNCILGLVTKMCIIRCVITLIWRCTFSTHLQTRTTLEETEWSLFARGHYGEGTDNSFTITVIQVVCLFF